MKVTRVTLVRVGIIALLALAVIQGVMAGRDVGHRAGAPTDRDQTRPSAKSP